MPLSIGPLVAFQDSQGIFGGPNAGEGNIVANESETVGVNAQGTSKVAVLGNSIYDNFGVGLANDYAFGVNDAFDVDTGANDHLNHPEDLIYIESAGNTDLSYRLDVPAGSYRIEFFSNTVADPSGYGEGETYLGFQNIISAGAGQQSFATTLTGVSLPNISATATYIDGDQPSGFGYTSSFSEIAQEPPPEADLALTKTLLNPEDAIVGGQLEYEFTITNNGSDDFDLINAPNADLGADSLLVDIMPPEISYDSNTGTDINCFTAGPGSASSAGPAFANHSDHEVVGCGYTGTGQIVSSGQSFSFTITVNVQSGLSGSFTNYALVPGGISGDPDMTTIEAAFGSGNDVITELGNTVNNLASAETNPYVADTSISKTLTNPQYLLVGGRADYQITYTNNGPDDADLSSFGTPGGGPGLIYDFVPADLINPSGYLMDGPLPGSQIINVGNPDLTCLYGPAPTPVTFGITTDTTLGMVACWLTGADKTLESGSSISAELSFEVAPDSDLVFTNYVLGTTPNGDPDGGVMSAAFGSGDLLSYLVANPINNFATSVYPAPVAPDGNNNGGANTIGDILAGTGQSTLILIGIASLLMLSSGVILSRRPR